MNANVKLRVASIMMIAAVVTSCSTTTSFLPASPCSDVVASCHDGDAGVFIGDPDLARDMLSTIDHAAERFAQTFGRPPAKVLVYQLEAVDGETLRRLRENGLALQLPWLGNQDRRVLIKAEIERQIRSQMASLPEDVRDGLVEQTVEKALEAKPETVTGLPTIETSAIAHELGHLWFIEAFGGWDPKAGFQSHGYGGMAPDWLDEAAAIALESDRMKADRRTSLQKRGAIALIPLNDFLSMPHPGLEAAQKRRKEREERQGNKITGSNVQITVLGGDGAAATRGAADFYSQALMFTEFLQEMTGNKLVLADIAEQVSRGATLEDWLQSLPDEQPKSVAALQLSWLSWVERQLSAESD